MQSNNSISHKIFKTLSIKVMIIAVVIFILFMIFVLPAASRYADTISGTTTSPDTSIIYTADDIYKMADLYGQEGRDSYIFMRFTFDLVWPCVYLFFMTAIMANLLKGFKERSWQRNLIWLPFLGVMFDFLENIFAVIVFARFPNKTPIIAGLTPIWTLVKWTVLGASFFIIVVLIVCFFIRRIKNKA